MKKISFILLALLCWSSMVSAQENNNRLRKKYRNLSFVKQEFEPASYFGMDQTLKSNFAGPRRRAAAPQGCSPARGRAGD